MECSTLSLNGNNHFQVIATIWNIRCKNLFRYVQCTSWSSCCCLVSNRQSTPRDLNPFCLLQKETSNLFLQIICCYFQRIDMKHRGLRKIAFSIIIAFISSWGQAGEDCSFCICSRHTSRSPSQDTVSYSNKMTEYKWPVDISVTASVQKFISPSIILIYS